MPVRLRLMRIGQRHAAHYRVVAADSRFPRNGRHLEMLGSYHPVPDKEGYKRLRLKHDRVKYWLSVGAQPTRTVEKLLGDAAILPVAPVKSRVPAWALFPNAPNAKRLAREAAERLAVIPDDVAKPMGQAELPALPPGVAKQ